MTSKFRDCAEKIHGLEDFLRILDFYGIEYSKDSSGYKTNCPLHQEKTPSFYVTEKNGKATFKCFGCNKGGDVVDFIKYKENISDFEALKEAYRMLNLDFDLKPTKLDELKEYIYNDMQNDMKKKDKSLKDYRLEDIFIYMLDDNTPTILKTKYRSLIDKSLKKMGTYKIIVNKEGKYRPVKKEKDEEFKCTIYNYPRVKKAIEKGQNIYIVEGEKDAETLIKLGLAATTFYTKSWKDIYTKQLQNAKIVFIGDTGEAGEDFKNFVWKNLKDNIITFRVVDLPRLEELGDNKDVTDWLEAGHTKDELINAIKHSWDWKISTRWKDVKITSKKNGPIEVKPLKTIDNFKLILKRNNTKLFFNEISKQIEVKTKVFKNANLNTLTTELQTQAIKEGLNCTLGDVTSWINAIAYENSVNPFREYLDSLKGKWDGKSRLKEFYDCFKTVEFFNQKLKEKIFKFWLLQFVDSAYNPNFTAQGILVLKGNQGIGKTTSMKNLIPINEPWVFLSEQKFEPTRDCIQTITSNQLVELSEFARSNKQVDALKGFVTSPTDKLVLKYDKYPIEFKRKTVYYATVNDSEFLIDDENRRFWVIDLTSIDLEKIEKFDFNQLWAELYYMYHVENDKKCYFDKEELIELEENNQNYKFQGEAESLIMMNFDFNNPRRVWLSTVEVIYFLGKTYSSTKITRTLKSMKIKQKPINNKNMPRGNYNAMPLPRRWNGKIEKEYKNRIVDIEVVENSKNESTKELKNQIKALKTMLLRYKKENEKLKIENRELKEFNQWYEDKFNEEIK